MNKVTYFDVEYANSKNKSICQIGIMCEDFYTGEPYYPELDIYINPEDGFDDNCIKIHGITPDQVKDKDNFPTVWKTIEKYFINAVIIGHNVASADLDALVKTLTRYNIDVPEMYYICTYELAKKLIPDYSIKNYSMSALCDYFDIDIDSEHNAFDDACACSDLFKTMIEEYNINADEYTKKYEHHSAREFTDYISNPMLRKSISEFYGVIRGFSIDNIINAEETAYIEHWRQENAKFSAHEEINNIISTIDVILDDGKVTLEEIVKLQGVVKSYLDIVSTSEVTLATQILDGILKGITLDREISADECKNLRQWLYDNIYLSDHFPFNNTIEMVDSVLADGVITKEESAYITSVISDMLNPIDSLKEQINTVERKSVCLTGNFSYGPKTKVEKYIIEHGGTIHSTVKKTTDILIVGDYECQAYSYGNYGTKAKRAMEYNEKGCNIKIIKETDFFSKQ